MKSLLLLFLIASGERDWDRETKIILAANPTACWSASAGYGVDGALQIGWNPSGEPTPYFFPNYCRQYDANFATNETSWGMCVSFRIDYDRGLPQHIASKNKEWRLYYDYISRKLLLILYKGNQQAVLTSNITIEFNRIYSICCGFDVLTSQSYLKINQMPLQVTSIPFVPFSGTEPFCLGYHEPNASVAAFYGVIDSLGWAKQAFTEEQMSVLNSGVRWEDIPQLQELFADWYDFGNEWRHSPRQLEWDWLMSNISNRSLQPVVVQLATPQVVPGFFAPLRNSRTNTTSLWYPDITGHGHYMLQPWYIMRCGLHDKVYKGTDSAFWFDGTFYPEYNYNIGHYMPCWSEGLVSQLTGDNKPWSAVWVAAAMPNSQQNPPDEFLGLTLGGTNSHGYVPWRPHMTGTSIVPEASGHSVKYSLNEHYNPMWIPQVNHWVSRRQADNNSRMQIASPTVEPIDYGNWHCYVYVFNGVRSKFWKDGRLVYDVDHLIAGTSGPIGTMKLRSYSIGGGCYSRDEHVYQDPWDFFSGGGWAWCGWQKVSAIWTGILPDDTAKELSRLLLKPTPRFVVQPANN